MINNFKELRASTLSELCGRTEGIKSLADEYLSRFNGDGILKLFCDETDKKAYFDRYSIFAINLSCAIPFIEDSVAKISRLISLADGSCDNEETATLCELFSKCELFLGTISEFLLNNNKNFSAKEDFKAALALNSARELKCSVDNFLSSLKQ